MKIFPRSESGRLRPNFKRFVLYDKENIVRADRSIDNSMKTNSMSVTDNPFAFSNKRQIAQMESTDYNKVAKGTNIVL